MSLAVHCNVMEDMSPVSMQAKHGRRELAALGGAAVDLAAGRPSRRLGNAGSPGLLPSPQLDAMLEGGGVDEGPVRPPASPPGPPPAPQQEHAPPQPAALSPQRQVHAPALSRQNTRRLLQPTGPHLMTQPNQ